MLYNLEFQLAVLEVLQGLNAKDKKFYTVREVADNYILRYPSDMQEGYKKTTFRKRVRDALNRYSNIEKIEKKTCLHPTYKGCYYTFKIKVK